MRQFKVSEYRTLQNPARILPAILYAHTPSGAVMVTKRAATCKRSARQSDRLLGDCARAVPSQGQQAAGRLICLIGLAARGAHTIQHHMDLGRYALANLRLAGIFIQHGLQIGEHHADKHLNGQGAVQLGSQFTR